MSDKIASLLGEIVGTPLGNMRLVEIYSNGNVACIPINCTNYHGELKEFHIDSIKPIGESKNAKH